MVRASLLRRWRLGLLAWLFCLAPATPVWAQLCGNGIADPGEPCDVAATASGLDECDGCAADCTLTEECGPTLCSDGSDNDGDGLMDSEDPDCTALTELQNIALLGSGARPIVIKRDARIAKLSGRGGGIATPFPHGPSRTEVCARQITVRDNVVIEGSLTATESALFRTHQPAGIAEELALAQPSALKVQGLAPLVGDPLGICSISGSACLSALDCPEQRATCDGRLGIDPANPAVDLDASGEGADEMQRCGAALARSGSLGELADVPGAIRTSLNVKAFENRVLNVGSGLNLFRIDRVRVAFQATLTINGPPDAVVILDVEGAFRIAARGRIAVAGGMQPNHVLWNLSGRTRRATCGARSLVTGTLLAPARQVRLAWLAAVRGAVYGAEVVMAPETEIEHEPFTAALPANLEISASPRSPAATAGAPLTYDVLLVNPGVAGAAATTVSITLDDAVSFTAASASQGVCQHDGSASGGSVRCFLGSVAAGQSAGIEVVANVAADASGPLTLTAEVRHATDGGAGSTTTLETAVVAP